MEIMDEDYKINADNIDVEEIMSKIKQNIKERGYTEEEIISNFDFTPEEKIGVDIDGISSLHHSWNINLEKEIESSPGIIGKSKIFFKKSIITDFFSQDFKFGFFCLIRLTRLSSVSFGPKFK